jgi:hypothetical protein
MVKKADIVSALLDIIVGEGRKDGEQDAIGR